MRSVSKETEIFQYQIGEQLSTYRIYMWTAKQVLIVFADHLVVVASWIISFWDGKK